MNTIASSRSGSGSGNIVVDKLINVGYILTLMLVGFLIGLALDRWAGTNIGVLLTFAPLVNLRRDRGDGTFKEWKAGLGNAFFLAAVAAVLAFILLKVPFTAASAGAFATLLGGGMPFPLTAAIVTFAITVGVWLHDSAWNELD